MKKIFTLLDNGDLLIPICDGIRNPDEDVEVNLDKFEPCGYCGAAGSITGLSGHGHGTCSYCNGLGMVPRQNN